MKHGFFGKIRDRKEEHMRNRMTEVCENKMENHIYPFLWMHGEEEATLLKELDQIRESNIGAVCIEARPHPDFGGKRWWQDMDLVMNYAREHQMKVWLLDDDRFPTGHANKIFSEGNHELANEFLTYSCTDVLGPLIGGSMVVHSVINEDSTIVGAAICRRIGGNSPEVDLSTCVDVSHHIQNGWLRLDVPVGLWRIFLFYTTHQGDGKLDYFNILNSDSVKLLIDQVYEPHFEHYGEDFGKTFEGFFSDEPEFGNLPWYDFRAKLGENMKFIPWSEELQERLVKRWGTNFVTALPALWQECGATTGNLHYEYMDEVTKQLKVAFSDQIHDWCKAHNVLHIGHIIEDDNSHGRLGCSTGHYFRSLSGMGMAGIDVVLLQVMPGMNQEVHQWVVSQWDGEFFHYGLGKLGSSLAHIDEKKKGNAMCEIFGAFGWQEGVTLMKWLTDHMLSRGINYFVPHAFSAKEFPDPDCPPHFYAGGNHPQYPYFKKLMRYMNRGAHLLSGGRYLAQIGVLYHGDSEWAGEAMLFQKPVRVFMENQMECDVIPGDIFAEENMYNMSYDEVLCVGEQRYEMLVIPYCKYLSKTVAEAVIKLSRKGFPVCFVDGYPEKISEQTADEQALITALHEIEMVPLNQLATMTRGKITVKACMEDIYRDLRIYTYENDYGIAVYCFNESVSTHVHTHFCIQISEEYIQAIRYQMWENKKYELPLEREEDRVRVPLMLECGEATILIFQKKKEKLDYYHRALAAVIPLCGTWFISYSDIKEYPKFHPWKQSVGAEMFPDFTDWMAEKAFCGMVRYTTEIESDKNKTVKLRIEDPVDAAEVFLNGACLGQLVGKPYEIELFLKEGANTLMIEIPTTPVWRAGDERSTFAVLPPFGMIKKPLLLEE